METQSYSAPAGPFGRPDVNRTMLAKNCNWDFCSQCKPAVGRIIADKLT